MSVPRSARNRLDAETRCAHHDSPLDIIAIKMKCCGMYFACKDCHAALADHSLEPLAPRGMAVECRALRGLRLRAYNRGYMESLDRCPACGSPFNPGCRDHRWYYFSGA